MSGGASQEDRARDGAQRTVGGPAGEAGRTSAEWVTFAVACLVLAVVAALALSQMVGPQEPAAPRAVITGLTSVQGERHVAVEVTNDGDDTATNVQVVLETTVGGEKEEADQVIDFLAGGEIVHLVFVVDPDIGMEQLVVSVTGFTEP